MAETRMTQFYDVFKECVEESKRMKFIEHLGNIREFDVELFKKMPGLLHHTLSVRKIEKMNLAVFEAFMANYLKLERFSRYKRVDDLIYDEGLGAFEAYMIVMSVSNRFRHELLCCLHGSDVTMEDYNNISCRKNNKVLFSGSILKFLDFYLHHPFKVKNVQLICQCTVSRPVRITREVPCLFGFCDFQTRKLVPPCDILGLLGNVETVETNSRCIKGLVCRLEVDRLVLRDRNRPAIALKMEGDVLKVVNNWDVNFQLLLKKIKLKGEPKKLNLHVSTYKGRYLVSGVCKPFLKKFKKLEEVSLVYTAHRMFASNELCKEAEALAEGNLRVNFRLRRVYSSETPERGVMYLHGHVGRIFDSHMVRLVEKDGCGYAFDRTDRNLTVHFCFGRNQKCGLRTNEEDDGEPANPQNSQNESFSDDDEM